MTVPVKVKKKTAAPVTKLLADLRQEFAAAEVQRGRRFLAQVAPDRTAVRPGVAVAQLRTNRQEVAVGEGELFMATGTHGSVDFLTVRDEVVPAVTVASSESFEEGRPLVSGRAERGGLRVVLTRPSSGDPWPDRLRFYLADEASAAAAYQALGVSGICAARAEGNSWQLLRFMPCAAEHAERLFPHSPLGCPGRALLAAWFHAPHVFPFFEIAGLADAAGTGASVEIVFLVRDAAAVAGVPANSICAGCVPLVNRRAETVHVFAEATNTFTPLPVPSDQIMAGVGRVQVFRGQGDWAECRPWLGTRHPWRHKTRVASQYVVASEQGRPVIGLVEPGAGLATAALTQLHVELILADPQVHTVTAGTMLTGNRGQRAEIVSPTSPLLLPAEIDPAELAAETVAAGWLARGRAGDVTEALRAVLERAAGSLTTVRGGQPPLLPAALAQVEALMRAVARPGPVVAGCCGTELTVELDAGGFLDRSPYLFATVLERALGFFARPLTYTRLVVRSEGGEWTWTPRLPGV